ncbi:hypothetical protein DICVIV_14092, partial [Dictyocaulus viviparus]
NYALIATEHKNVGLLNIEKYEDMYPNALSGGQQQLVTIARVMAQSTDVVLLDEPFSNLDMLSKSKNTPVLMVTHDLQEALNVADFIYVMKN